METRKWCDKEALLSCDIVESNSKAECKDSTYGVDQNNELQELLAAPYWFDVLPAEEKTKRTADSPWKDLFDVTSREDSPYVRDCPAKSRNKLRRNVLLWCGKSSFFVRRGLSRQVVGTLRG